MGVLEVQWSRALSLVCEVALSHLVCLVAFVRGLDGRQEYIASDQ